MWVNAKKKWEEDFVKLSRAKASALFPKFSEGSLLINPYLSIEISLVIMNTRMTRIAAINGTAVAKQRIASPSLRTTHVRRSVVCSAAQLPPSNSFSVIWRLCWITTSALLLLKSSMLQTCLRRHAENVTAGALAKWGSAVEELPERRNVILGELKRVGVKVPDAIAKVSVRSDATFLITTVGVSSIAAVALSQLPGDWGFFSAYLVGGVPILVLAIGSVNPGILQFAIDFFSQVFPDYRERVLRHEAGHFLLGHLMGVPVANYSLIIGKEHTDLAEAALQKRLITQTLGDTEVNRLSIIALGGATAEAMHFEDVMGQTQDLFDLQRIMNRSASKLGAQQQQNQTRWAAYQAAALLQKYNKEYTSLMEVMQRGGTVDECIRAIEEC